MRQQKIDFLKFEHNNNLKTIKSMIKNGKIVDAYLSLEEVIKRYCEMFPFEYGSEMDRKGYSDEKVVE